MNRVILAFLIGAVGCFSSLAAESAASAAVTLDLGNGVILKLASIPAGTFLMGCQSNEFKGENLRDEGLHEVTISKPFYLGATHVTVDQFAVFAKETGYLSDAEKKGVGPNWRNPGIEQMGDHPVVCISWNDAQAFCDWLSAKQKKKCHLPTEAQWEYACRAGTQTTWCWGTNAADGKEWGKWGAAKPGAAVNTYAVASFKPNAWGLYDLHGNALQWCSDYYGPYPKEAVTDPVGSQSSFAFDLSEGKSHVLRGGAGHLDIRNCRAAYRHWGPVDHRFSCLGFRVCVEGP